MTRRLRRTLAALAVAGAGLCVACQPPPATTAPADPVTCESTPTPTPDQRLAVGATVCGSTLTVPDVDGVLVVGDSITWQAYMSSMFGGRGLDRPLYGAPGWELRYALPHLRQVVGPDTILVIATGTNDGSDQRDGWDGDDQAALDEVMAMGNRCTALVLPALGPGARPAHAANLEQVRDVYLATGAPVADWRFGADTPGVMAADGIHLAAGPGGLAEPPPVAVDARNAVIEAAVAGCTS